MTDFATLFERRFGLPAPVGARDVTLKPASARLLGRASVRSFRPDPVPGALLAALLACAQSAPAKSNLQQYSIVVVEDRAKRERLAELIPTAAWAAAAPVFLVFLGDVRRGRRVAAMRGYTHDNDNVDTFLNAAVDAALAMQCFVTAAEAEGLGCCPISMVRNQPEALAALLDLPAGVFPVAGLAAGWPAAAPAVSTRLPPTIVVHRDRYDDGDLETEIDAYDDRVFARAPVPPDKQRHVDRYGTAERGTWSENAARQLSLPERAGFRAWLRQQDLALD